MNVWRSMYALTVIPVLLLACLTAGCTSNSNIPSPDGEDGSGSRIEQVRKTDEDGTDERYDESATQVIDFQSIEEVGNFNDGVAWITLNGGKRALIDLRGTVLFESDEYYHSVSPYCEGVSLVWVKGTDTARLLDKKGEVIWSVENDGLAKAEELYGADAVNSVDVQMPLQYYARESWSDEVWHGYTVVEFDVDSFEYTGVLAGLLGPDGTWKIEPPTLEEASVHADNRHEDLGTHGYGDSGSYERYSVSLNHRGILIYRTGEVLPYTGYDQNGFEGISYGGRWRDEIDFAEEMIAHQNRRYVGAGRFEDAAGNTILELGDNFPLYSGGFFDGPIQEDSFVDSEYCIVYLENSGGGKYFTVIDGQGNCMFDPMRSGYEGLLRGGVFFHRAEGEETGRYYTIEGNPLGEMRGETGTPFYEGRAWIRAEGYWRCIDEKGDVVV